MSYDQYKKRYEIPKAWKDKKQDIMNQWNKGFQSAPFRNMEKSFQNKDYHSNTQSAQRGRRIVNLGVKKVGDSPREPLKY